MRSSQRALAAAFGFVVIVMAGFMAWFRLVAEPMPTLSGQRTSKTYDLSGFDGVDVSGQWRATIVRGDAWSVEVEVPTELVDKLGATVRGDRLSLGLISGWCTGCAFEDVMLEASIVMPALESLDMSGMSAVSFSGFAGPALSLDLSGFSTLTGTASRFDKLTLDMSGGVNVDLSDVPVTDADVDVSGAGNLKLRMAGGRLTGDMSGAANVEYFGSVSAETIDRSGISSVRHRD